VATVPAPFVRTALPVLGRFEVDMPEAGRVRLATAGEDWLLTSLYWHGFPPDESTALRAFRRLARHSGVVLDVGANVGLFTLAAAVGNPGATVHALEPLPSSFDTLRQVVRDNGLHNVHVHETGLADADGEATLYVPRGGAASKRDASIVEGFREDCDAVPIRLATLDAFAADHALTGIDLMKVDVGSAEHRVLAGGTRVLERDRPVILCEVLRGTTEDRLHDVLSEHGYGYHWISGGGLVEQERPLGDPEYRFRDYLLVPREKRDWAVAVATGERAAT